MSSDKLKNASGDTTRRRAGATSEAEGRVAETPRPMGATPDPADPEQTLAFEGERAPSQGWERLKRGSLIGRYVVVERLGAGGMGVVYAAYDPHLDRKLAIKLVLPVDASAARQDRMRGRLLREAQALAKLSHPNVVAVHDVGQHEGMVYVAMELVVGQTLRAWMKEGRHTWFEVRAVFEQAGRGLEAAHAAGIVHRDFKPENVIVGPDGHVWVLDFGLARAFEGGGGRESAADLDLSDVSSASSSALAMQMTRAGALIGTPAYMAPEQYSNRVTDGRTDQFAFCVALWEALHGDRPFEGESPQELLLHAMRGELRPWPSTSGVPPHVEAALRRGLAARASDRWPSMRDLLVELASDPGARRRKIAGGIAGGFGAAGLLALAWGVHSSEAEICGGAAQELQGIWDEGRRREVQTALEGTGLPYASGTWERLALRLDAYTEAWTTSYRDACEATRLRGVQSAELMDARMACLSTRRRDLSALVETLVHADVSAVEHALEAAGKLASIAPCDDPDHVLAVVPPPEDSQTKAQVEEIRLSLSQAKALFAAGRYEEGAKVAADALAHTEPLDYAPIEIEARFMLGQLQAETGVPAEGYQNIRRAFIEARRVGMDVLAAEAAMHLVYVLAQRLDRLEDALGWVERARAEAARYGDAQMKATVEHHVGSLYRRQGRYEEALARYDAALEIHDEAATSDKMFVASVLHDKGRTLSTMENHNAAAPLLEETVGVYEEALGNNHPLVASSLLSLGGLEEGRGHYEVALDLYRRALAIVEEMPGGQRHPLSPRIDSLLGKLLFKRGDLDQAMHHFQRELAAVQETVGAESPAAAEAMNSVALVHYRRGEFEAGIALQQRGLAIIERELGADHPSVARGEANLGNAYAFAQEYDESLVHQQRALELLSKAFGSDHPQVGRALNNLGILYEDMGEPEKAQEHFERAIGILQKLGDDHPDLAFPLYRLGLLHMNGGRDSQAIEAFERALSMAPEGNPEFAADAEINLAQVLWSSRRDRNRAIELARSAYNRYLAIGDRRADGAQAARDWLSKRRVFTPSSEAP